MRGRTVASDHSPNDVTVDVQLPRDRSDAPLLDRIQAKDLRDQVRGYGHGATRVPTSHVWRGIRTPGEASPAAGHRSGSSAAMVEMPAHRWPPRGSRCRWCMRPVDQRPPPAGNPGASLYIRRQGQRRPQQRPCRAERPAARCVRASAVNARHAARVRRPSAGNERRPRAAPSRASDASKPDCNTDCRDRSGCTRRPACGIRRIGTDGLDDPTAPPN